MPEPLNFKEIAATPIADVARALGFALTEKGEQLVGPCPISKTNNPTAFKLTPSMNRFICFCAECKKLPKQGGDCIEMVRRFRKLDSHREAAMEVQKLTGGGGSADDNPSTKQEAASSTAKSFDFDPLKYLATLDPEHDAVRGVASPDTLRAMQGGWCSKGVHRGRLSIAVCDAKGTILAFVGVALDSEEPELLFHKGFVPPSWFNVHNLKAGELRIAPTIQDVLEYTENGHPNIICPLVPTTPQTIRELADILEERQCTVAW